MNYYQVQDMFKSMYPGKTITYEFDEKCHRIHELIYTDGKPNPHHHIENQKVRVNVEGMDPIYVPIIPHRETCTWEHIKKIINSKTEIYS